ncbi:MAG: hypothetical protein M5R41_19370 [Bacteroidia bacterium]|nr:hypothetical protein [Bacteroidia bacterium]
MVKLNDPKWTVLRHFIDTGDRAGLASLNQSYFTGLARTVYNIACEQMELSMPVIREAMSVAMDPVNADEAYRLLMDNRPDDYGIDSYIAALAKAWMNYRIKESVDWAAEQIGEGQNRLIVAEELMSRLSTVHDAKELKSLEEVFTVMETLEGTSIPTGMRELKDIGIDSWQMGNLMILAGDTGTFKTTAAVNLNMAALTADPELHVIYFMKEQPFHEVWYKAFTYWSPYSYTRIQSQMNARNAELVRDVRRSLTDEALGVLQRFHVVDQNDFSRPGDVANQLRHYASKYKRVMWVVDYITRLDFGGRPEHFNSYYTAGLEVLKNIALQTQSFGIIISQFKDGWNIDYKSSKPVKMFPNRSHIIWSSENKNLAAYILLLYHPGTYFDYPKRYLYGVMGKVRHTDSARRMNWIIDGAKQKVLTPSDEETFNMNTLVSQFKSTQ